MGTAGLSADGAFLPKNDYLRAVPTYPIYASDELPQSSPVPHRPYLSPSPIYYYPLAPSFLFLAFPIRLYYMSKTLSSTVSPMPTSGSQSWRFHAKELQNKKTLPLRQMAEFQGMKGLLYPDDWFVEIWASFISLLMLYTATVTPYRVALVDNDSNEWIILDYVIDILFGCDVCFNCLLCYYDEEMTLITSHKRIFMHYLSSWMLPDVVASLPFQLILELNSNYNNLIRIIRLPRVYKLIKLAKLFRIMKVIKNRNRIVRYVNSILRISLSIERLVWFVLWLVLLLHLFACCWIFFGKLNDGDPDNWIICRGYSDYSPLDLYIVGIYFSVTTLATVGYGDITACNTTERIVCSAMMLVGIFVYSVTIGSLTNLLGNLDRRKAALNQKLELLVELSDKYNFNKLFFQKLSQAVEYEHRNSRRELDDLITGLPSTLRTQLLIVIYCKMIEKNSFFEGRTDHFVAWIAPQLAPVRIVEDEYVYREGEPSIDMYFVIRGMVDYVLIYDVEQKSYHAVGADYYFGEEDLLFSDNKMHNFTTKTKEKSEFLTLSKEKFDLMITSFESEALEITALTEKRKQRISEHKAAAEEQYRAKSEVIRHESAPRNKSEIQSTVNEFMKHNQELEESSASSDEEDIEYHKERTIEGGMSPSIDLLPREDSVSRSSTVQRLRSTITGFGKVSSRNRKYGELKVVQQRMGKMEARLEELHRLMTTVCEHLGAGAEDRRVVSPPDPSARSSLCDPENPPLLDSIAEAGSKELETEERDRSD